MTKAHFTLLVLVCTLPPAAWSSCIDVYYPDTQEPYRGIIREIIMGIQSQKPNDVVFHHHKPVEGVYKHCQVNISIGKKSWRLLAKYPTPLVVGGVFAHRNQIQHPGLSLIPRPKLLFIRLKHFRPGIKTIWTLYSQESQPLIDSAKQDALELGLTLNTVRVRNKMEATSLMDTLTNTIEGKKEALWLSHDHDALPTKDSLEIILKRSWERKFVFFSSKPDHVIRGALFSVVPDYIRMGQQLSKLAQSCLRNQCQGEFAYLSSVKTSINSNTAHHQKVELQGKYTDILHPRN